MSASTSTVFFLNFATDRVISPDRLKYGIRISPCDQVKELLEVLIDYLDSDMHSHNAQIGTISH